MGDTLQSYQTKTGIKIYRIPLKIFPGFWDFAHLVVWDAGAALVDVGSGLDECNTSMERGLQAIKEQYGERIDWEAITHVLISHSHIDHFGGLHFIKSRTKAGIGIHELDLRVLSRFEERLSVAARRLHTFLLESGLDEERIDTFMDLYLLEKQLFSSIEVDFTYEAQGMTIGPIQIIHVPGHCPGHVVFLIDDILLSGDHILEKTSPHQAPERITLNTGLGHYLDSLIKLMPLSSKLRLVLRGHEGPIKDLKERIQQIQAVHLDLLSQILNFLSEPKTIAQVADHLFGTPDGYHGLLAIEESGAHTEYLLQRSYISIDNWLELEADPSQPLRLVKSDDEVVHLRIPGLTPGKKSSP